MQFLHYLENYTSFSFRTLPSLSSQQSTDKTVMRTSAENLDFCDSNLYETHTILTFFDAGVERSRLKGPPVSRSVFRQFKHVQTAVLQHKLQ